MLTEQFLTSLETSGKTINTSVIKDVGIHLHDFKPSYAARSGLKKSSTPPKCLAVSSTHIFAAQSDKAVVHVYSRERGNQEAVVPFAERIHAVEFVGDNGGLGVLALGTEGGRVILWEVHTGRQVTTPPSHLQEVTALASDPTNGFLLSGSSDSKVHVWSMLALLSFCPSPKDNENSSSSSSLLHTFSNHRSGVTGVQTGHSRSQSNIAISISKSNDCLVWNLRTGELLRTFILSAVPASLAVDPCDRACHVGFDDGSVQLIDFFKASPSSLKDDPTLTSTPVQPPGSDHWSVPSESGAGSALCVAVSYEGNHVLSGHSDGQVRVWDVATRNCFTIAGLFAPVTNLLMLPLSGLPGGQNPGLKLHQITKPRYESSLSANRSSDGSGASGNVPYSHTISAQFVSSLPRGSRANASRSKSAFSEAFTQPSLPSSLLVYPGPDAHTGSTVFMDSLGNPDVDAGSTQPSSTLAELEKRQSVLWQKMVQLRADKVRAEKAAEAMAEKERKSSRTSKTVNGTKGHPKGTSQRGKGGQEDEATSDATLSSSSLNEDSSIQLTSDDEDSLDDPAPPGVTGEGVEEMVRREDDLEAMTVDNG